MGVVALTLQAPSSRRLMRLSSSTSCSSSISPTICSSTSSMVATPLTCPYSSTTTAMWLRASRNSRSSTFSRLLSGMTWAGRMQSLRSKSALPGCPLALCSIGSRSLACRMPLMSSGSSANTGKRECRDSMITCSSSSKGLPASRHTNWERGTMMSRACMSAICRAPRLMLSASSSIRLRCAAVCSISLNSARSSGWPLNRSTSHSRRPVRGSASGCWAALMAARGRPPPVC